MACTNESRIGPREAVEQASEERRPGRTSQPRAGGRRYRKHPHAVRVLLIADGHDVVSASDGAAALERGASAPAGCHPADVRMPAMVGLEVCRRLKADPATPLTPVVLVTGQTDLSDRIRGIEAGADEFLSKPVHPHELRARVRSLSRVKHLIDDLDSAEAAFMTLALTIEARDPLTKGHCERLASHAVRLGQAIGLGDEDLEALHRAVTSTLGKVGIPAAVLLSPAPQDESS